MTSFCIIYNKTLYNLGLAFKVLCFYKIIVFKLEMFDGIFQSSNKNRENRKTQEGSQNGAALRDGPLGFFFFLGGGEVGEIQCRYSSNITQKISLIESNVH